MPQTLTDATLSRLAGAAAVLGGLLRVAGSFTMGALDERALQLSYFVTDVFLLLGLLGIYLRVRARVGWGGLCGFVLGVMGVLVIRSAALFGGGGYAMGAGMLLVGLGLLGVLLLLAGGPRPGPCLWLLSLVAGVLSAAAPGLPAVAALAGVLFGAGYIAAGVDLLRARG